MRIERRRIMTGETWFIPLMLCLFAAIFNPALAGDEAFRPPAIPLDPYFRVRSCRDRLTDGWARELEHGVQPVLG
jgi:hypothetical protein